MRKHEANEIANPGFYWNRKTWDLTTVEGAPKALPGEPGTTYLRVPAPLVLAVAPLMGALYVMFLPVIGFAMLAHHLANKIRHTAAPNPTEPAREETVPATH